MAGHSKWANIQHRKKRQDNKRGKLFTKLIKEITVAAREGGGDADSNPRLRLALDKAFSGNMNKETVEKAINRGTGNLEGVSYEELTYEGYSSSGVAIIVECVTDSKNRTIAEVRHVFSRFSGNPLEGSKGLTNSFQYGIWIPVPWLPRLNTRSSSLLTSRYPCIPTSFPFIDQTPPPSMPFSV